MAVTIGAQGFKLLEAAGVGALTLIALKEAKAEVKVAPMEIRFFLFIGGKWIKAASVPAKASIVKMLLQGNSYPHLEKKIQAAAEKAAAKIPVTQTVEKTEIQLEQEMEAEPFIPHTLVLVKPGEKVLLVINKIRKITGLGLKDAKALVQGSLPKPVITATKQGVADLVSEFTKLGATVQSLPASVWQKKQQLAMAEETEGSPADVPEKEVMLGGSKLIEVPEVTWGVWPVKGMEKYTPAKLSDAVNLYQPVRGTGKGSRYFVVAGRDDLKMAARWINNNLSVRVEGNLTKYQERLLATGFGFGGAEQHMSVHLNVGDEITAAKALGAMILGVGLQFKTPTPEFSVIANKGS